MFLGFSIITFHQTHWKNPLKFLFENIFLLYIGTTHPLVHKMHENLQNWTVNTYECLLIKNVFIVMMYYKSLIFFFLNECERWSFIFYKPYKHKQKKTIILSLGGHNAIAIQKGISVIYLHFLCVCLFLKHLLNIDA